MNRHKNKIGLTSVTFRKKSVEEILDICTAIGLDGIEWGGDVHLPPGDPQNADAVASGTRAHNLEVTSYGSYYRLCSHEDIEKEFRPVLLTASAIHAPIIRIWAGTVPSADATDAYYERAARELDLICDMADRYRISIGLEYHRNTLTDNRDSTRKLLDRAGRENLYTYWQMNPDLTHSEHLEEIKVLKDKICCVHTFYWGGKNTRLTMREGMDDWREFIELLQDTQCPFLFEFVKDDSVERLREDADTLKHLLSI